MTEHRASFIQKFFLKVSKVSCLRCFWKFILIISLNLVLILLMMTSLVSDFVWCFSRFLAFHISFSIVIWIVRSSFLVLLSLTNAFKMRTQLVDIIFAALLSFFITSKKYFHILMSVKEFIFSKLAGFYPKTLIKMELLHGYFSSILFGFLEPSFFQNHSEWLLLEIFV